MSERILRLDKTGTPLNGWIGRWLPPSTPGGW